MSTRQDEPALTISPVRIRPSSSSFFPASHFFSLSSTRHLPPGFPHLLAHANLPQPGPEYFAARRALWTTPTAASRLGQTPPISRVRLETLLDEPGALERPDVWDTGLKRVWKGLVEGGRLKNFLPLPCCRMSTFSTYFYFRLRCWVCRSRSFTLVGGEMEHGQIMLRSWTRITSLEQSDQRLLASV